MPRNRKRRTTYGGDYGAEELSPRDVRRAIRAQEHGEAGALAREVEQVLTQYRWTHSLSQQQLAERLGVKQPQVARLESGLVNPSMDTLVRISERLAIEFTLEISAEGLAVRYALPD